MDLITLPGVVTEEHVRLCPTDMLGDVAAQLHRVLEFPVDIIETYDAGGPQRCRSLLLFSGAALATGRGPARQRATAAEFDVVGMSPDR